MPYSTVLRQQSSLRRSGSKGNPSRVLHAVRKKCALPAELLDHIISLVLVNVSPRSFSTIASFSLASYQFRQVALRQWFSILKVSSVATFTNLCSVNGLYSWVRYLLCTSFTLLPKPTNVARFQNLESVIIDCQLIGQNKQYQTLKHILSPITRRITVLKLTALSRIDAATLRLISSVSPNLKVLELSCAERLEYSCCLDCFEESASCIIYAPVPRLYGSFAALGESFATALEPLVCLEHLFLGILLSEGDLGSFVPDPDYDGQERPVFELDSPKTIRANEALVNAIITQRRRSLRTISWGAPVHAGLNGTDHRSEPTIIG
ncbi:hypothetical protein OE88DRAFT_1679669 [Heliocybe sulcata]|uniref:F-box domain-containing protein n=1 Tax=Heliocybe sulcata TaxID=5364 RepID=A0A5C3N4I6_9AGAM|nr:hypothetical protein OE88DRAFT_1679669 [Heliocybe sulcata]